ncbi:hypothetical protein NQZ68_029356, partial [Dissostichus eleginoides]
MLSQQALSRQDSKETNRSAGFWRPQAELCGPRDPAPCCPPGSRQGDSSCAAAQPPSHEELLGSICC